MTVVKAETERLRRKSNPLRAMWGNERTSFFHGAIDLGGHELTVPMQQFWRIGVVVDVDDNPLAFCQAQQRARKLSIIERGGNNLIQTKLGKSILNLDCVIGLLCFYRLRLHKGGQDTTAVQRSILDSVGGQ